MQKMKKSLTTLTALLLALCLCGCSVPKPGFADYDVSGYVKALLDSSYHDSHQELMEISGVSEQSARENCSITIENAAIRFCNSYGLYPTEEQLAELREIMKQAYALTRYTVKSERKVDDGYYLEVEVASITNFEGRGTEMERLKAEARTAAETSEDGVDFLFVGKALDFCRRELANISYDPDSITIPLNILQTEAGELQLNLDEIEVIDQTVVRF